MCQVCTMCLCVLSVFVKRVCAYICVPSDDASQHHRSIHHNMSRTCEWHLMLFLTAGPVEVPVVVSFTAPDHKGLEIQPIHLTLKATGNDLPVCTLTPVVDFRWGHCCSFTMYNMFQTVCIKANCAYLHFGVLNSMMYFTNADAPRLTLH